MGDLGGKAPPKKDGGEKKSGGGFWGFLGDMLSNVSINVGGAPARAGRSSRNPTDPKERMQPVHAERKEAYEETIYRKTEGAAGTAPAVRVNRDRQHVARSLDARMGAGARCDQAPIPDAGGEPLAKDVRSQMEPRLGSDLSNVRIHRSGESAAAAEGMSAKAFTVGSDVHFNARQYAPGTKEGDRLLAHELTHVVQGQRSGVQRKSEPEADHGDAEAGGLDVSHPDEPAEKEADAMGDSVADDLHEGKADGDGQNDNKDDSRSSDKKSGDKKSAGKKSGNSKADDKNVAAKGASGEKANQGDDKSTGKESGGDKAAGGDKGVEPAAGKGPASGEGAAKEQAPAIATKRQPGADAAIDRKIMLARQDSEKPRIAAASPGVGRKILRKVKPTAPPAAGGGLVGPDGKTPAGQHQPAGGGARPAEMADIKPILGKLRQTVEMFTMWAARGTVPLAQTMLRQLETAREEAQALSEMQAKGVQDPKFKDRMAGLTRQLQQIQALDPKYELVSVGDLARTINNAKRKMPVVVPPKWLCPGDSPQKLPEFKRQLQDQQDGINSMLADTWKKNKVKYSGDDSVVPPVAGEGRTKEAKKQQAEFQKRSGNQPNTAAPHNSDGFGGGHRDPTGMPANFGVNSSIGNQWKGPPNRSKPITDAVDKMEKEQPLISMVTQMNVKLDVELGS